MSIFLILYIILFIFRQCKNYIVYPLKTFQENNILEYLLSFDSTYTTLEIGYPPQKVDFYFNINHQQIIITDKGCKSTNLYNINNSSTFKIIGEIEPTIQNNNKYLIIDNLNIYNNINFSDILEIEEFPFYSSLENITSNNKLCGNIGLSIAQYEMYNKHDKQIDKKYIEQLRQYGIEKNDDFSFFHYKNQDFLIYNIFLNNLFPNLFKDIKIPEWVYPVIRINTYELNWEIYMKEIYYNNVHYSPNDYLIFEINPLFEFIVGGNDYKINITKDYFNSYIRKGICSIIEYKNYNFRIFVCDEKKFKIKDIKKFPTLYISNIRIHHIFELNGNELFIKLNDKWYFQIVFPLEELNPIKWILGKNFLRKYPVLFSPSNKLIGFYIKPNNGIINKNQTTEEVENNKKFCSKNIIGYLKIILIAIIFTILGLLIGKKIFFTRRKRANELTDDYYDYDSGKKENKINKNNLQKDDNYIQIEMKNKLNV